MRCLVGACRLEERARGGGNGWCIESRVLERSTTNRRVTQTKEIEGPQENEKEDDEKVEDEW